MEGSGWVRLFQNIIKGCSCCDLTVQMVIIQRCKGSFKVKEQYDIIQCHSTLTFSALLLFQNMSSPCFITFIIS